jgi:hypothetical protein
LNIYKSGVKNTEAASESFLEENVGHITSDFGDVIEKLGPEEWNNIMCLTSAHTDSKGRNEKSISSETKQRNTCLNIRIK